MYPIGYIYVFQLIFAPERDFPDPSADDEVRAIQGTAAANARTQSWTSSPRTSAARHSSGMPRSP